MPLFHVFIPGKEQNSILEGNEEGKSSFFFYYPRRKKKRKIVCVNQTVKSGKRRQGKEWSFVVKIIKFFLQKRLGEATTLPAIIQVLESFVIGAQSEIPSFQKNTAEELRVLWNYKLDFERLLCNTRLYKVSNAVNCKRDVLLLYFWNNIVMLESVVLE